MGTRKLLPMVFLFLIIGCFSKYDYWDISEFKMVPSALKDGEKIKIIYFSGGPDLNIELKYYYHLIVVSQKTGDTVNLLNWNNNALDEDNYKNIIYNYCGPDNISTKLSQMMVINMDTITGIINVDEINKYKLKSISIIARDPYYDAITRNNYPTVIGSINQTVDKGYEFLPPIGSDK